MKSNPSASSKQGRMHELYGDTKGRAPLDQRLFPAVMARFDPHMAIEIMRSSLGPTVGPAFAEDLRAHIAWLYNALSAPDVDKTAQPCDRDRLLASMCEAIAHIEDWAERHGIEACGTLLEDAAARRGWPDETGRGWTPPWDILAIDRPYYWATDRSD